MTMTPDAFGAFLQGDIDKWAKVVEDVRRQGAVTALRILAGGAAQSLVETAAAGFEAATAARSTAPSARSARCATSCWRANRPTS